MAFTHGLKIIDYADFLGNGFSAVKQDTHETQQIATAIVKDVRRRGDVAVAEYAAKFGEREAGEPLIIDRRELEAAERKMAPDVHGLLSRVAHRISAFAQAQLQCLSALDVSVPGGRAGHTIVPIERVGCYVPGGRYPLPSTALMTVATARAAGCREIMMATPGPSDLMLAAASIAGADSVLAVGGAHAIGAMAYGMESLPPVNLIVGPGNRYVTAAKRVVSGDVGIDMLAGPSELLIVTDHNSDVGKVAADLLAQAEHDPDARPYVVSQSGEFLNRLLVEIETQLETLTTSDIARQSLVNGAAILCASERELIDVCNRIAPEHLELQTENCLQLADEIKHAGCVFLGENSAEVFGDYGVGPNHTLPTGGCARYTAGLNVFTFLRIRTWIQMSDRVPDSLVHDTETLAAIEGLEAHRRAASLRRN